MTIHTPTKPVNCVSSRPRLRSSGLLRTVCSDSSVSTKIWNRLQIKCESQCSRSLIFGPDPDQLHEYSPVFQYMYCKSHLKIHKRNFPYLKKNKPLFKVSAASLAAGLGDLRIAAGLLQVWSFSPDKQKIKYCTYNLSIIIKMLWVVYLLPVLIAIRTYTVIFTFVSWHLFQSFNLFRSIALLWHHFPERLVVADPY